MKWRLLLLCFFSISLMADRLQSQKAEYAISYGIVGVVGHGTATVMIEKNHYKVEIKAATQGIARVLSQGRKDWMMSEGKIINGVLLPDYFKKVVTQKHKTKSKTYRFYHDRHKVVVTAHSRQKIKELSTMDIVMGKTKKDIAFKVTESEHQEVLPYYAKDDLLSLFINLKRYLHGRFDDLPLTDLHAVGGDKKDGLVRVYSPQSDAIRTILGAGGHLIVVLINQDIFSSKKGELFIKLNDAGVALGAVLKDVVLFGDVRMQLTKLQKEGAGNLALFLDKEDARPSQQ